MKWIQATLTFEPLRPNPARKGGFGAWVVWNCKEIGNPIVTRVDDFGKLGKVMRMMVVREYPRGCVVNPLKLANAFNEAARADRERIVGILSGTDVLQFGALANG